MHGRGEGWGQAQGLEPSFSQALPAAGIRIFASQLHTHLAGRKVVTVLSRDGRERQVVNADGHYSPHFQVEGSAGAAEGSWLDVTHGAALGTEPPHCSDVSLFLLSQEIRMLKEVVAVFPVSGSKNRGGFQTAQDLPLTPQP